MRNLEECTAEVFRRGGQRIKERRKKRRRVLALCIPICLIAAVWSAMGLPAMTRTGEAAGNRSPLLGEEAEKAQGDSAGPGAGTDGFAFSLTWGCYGVSSYDSETGRLVKTTDASYPEDYVTTYWLTGEQKREIYDLIWNLHITAYPDTYNPHAGGLASDPSMTLILSVNTGDIQKTVTAADIAISYQSDNRKGQAFLDVCKAIEDILTATEEWKALPEYEVFYE